MNEVFTDRKYLNLHIVLSEIIDKRGEFDMKIDLEKRVNVVGSFDEIVKLSKKYLNDDSIKELRSTFNNYIITDSDDPSEEYIEIKLIDMIDRLIFITPKRIDRLLELKAPQCVIDSENLVLEIVKKIKEDNI